MAEELHLKTGDYLVCDPCYINQVIAHDSLRFDALKHVKTLYTGDDGEQDFYLNEDKIYTLGVDSGRIWLMCAEMDCTVKIDSGFSGHYVFSADSKYTPKDVEEGRLTIITEYIR